MLGTLCERVGVAFETGLDPHRVFEREAKKSSSKYGRKMRSVAEHVKDGSALSDAIKAQGNYFPPHFADMIEGGEKSGRLDRVLERLAEYYKQMAEFRSVFMSSILWPMVQLAMGIIIVGVLIYLPSILLKDADPERQDLIGIGLVGERGVLIYCGIIGIGAAVVTAFVWMVRNGWFRFVVEAVAYIPFLGKQIRVFAEARFVHTLALAIESGVDAASSIDLAFRSAGTRQYVSKADRAKSAVMQGQDIHTVLSDTHLFQEETIEVVELGEASGRLAESLDKHFKQLKSQVRHAMSKVTYLASAAIWLIIAAILIFIIIRVFSMYVDTLGDGASKIMTG